MTMHSIYNKLLLQYFLTIELILFPLKMKQCPLLAVRMHGLWGCYERETDVITMPRRG